MAIDTDYFYIMAGRVWSAHARSWWFSIERDDAIQAAVLRCWKNRDTFDPTKSSAATFFSMICRQEMGHRNAQAKRHADAVPYSLNFQTAEGTEMGEFQTARVETDMVEVRDEMALVESRIVSFTADERRDLFALKDRNGPANLSRRLGISRAAGSARCRKALQKAQEALI